MTMEDVTKGPRTAREPKPIVFNDAVTNLNAAIMRLDVLVSDMKGNLERTNEVKDAKDSPCFLVVWNETPNRLYCMSEHISKLTEEIRDMCL